MSEAKKDESGLSELLDCKCGKPAGVDYGGCTEFYGGTWQDVYVMCTCRCGYNVGIIFNADINGQEKIARDLVVDTWNRQMKAI